MLHIDEAEIQELEKAGAKISRSSNMPSAVVDLLQKLISVISKNRSPKKWTFELEKDANGETKRIIATSE